MGTKHIEGGEKTQNEKKREKNRDPSKGYLNYSFLNKDFYEPEHKDSGPINSETLKPQPSHASTDIFRHIYEGIIAA